MLKALLLTASLLVIGLGVHAYAGGGAAGASQLSKEPPAAPRNSVLAGRIVDGAGTPVAGVKVNLWSGMGTRFAGQSTTTDADGRYRFDPLTTGGGFSDGRQYPGVQIEHETLVSADAKDWWDVEVPLGETVTRDFTLTPGGRIAGSLTFGGGQWILREFPLRFACGDQRTAYATTTNNGSFTSPCLFPGEYDVTWNSAYPRRARSRA